MTGGTGFRAVRAVVEPSLVARNMSPPNRNEVGQIALQRVDSARGCVARDRLGLGNHHVLMDLKLHIYPRLFG